MTSRFTELIVDAQNPRKLAEFWCQVLDYEVTADNQGYVEIGEQLSAKDVRVRPTAPTIVFVPVPESKTEKTEYTST